MLPFAAFALFLVHTTAAQSVSTPIVNIRPGTITHFLSVASCMQVSNLEPGFQSYSRGEDWSLGTVRVCVSSILFLFLFTRSSNFRYQRQEPEGTSGKYCFYVSHIYYHPPHPPSLIHLIRRTKTIPWPTTPTPLYLSTALPTVQTPSL